MVSTRNSLQRCVRLKISGKKVRMAEWKISPSDSAKSNVYLSESKRKSTGNHTRRTGQLKNTEKQKAAEKIRKESAAPALVSLGGEVA
jgi:hypothetical protein